jgi:transposase
LPGDETLSSRLSQNNNIMQPRAHIFVGIDVSKDELVIAHPTGSKWAKCRTPNTPKDISAWLSTFDTCGKHFVLEATGPYSERLMCALGAAGATFSVVSPAQSRAMSKVLCKTNKNDDQDAQTLSVLGQKLDLIEYKMPTDAQKKRKEAFSALASLQKQERQLKNQIHAFEYRVNPNPVAVQALQTVLDTTQEAIETLQKELHPEQDEKDAVQTVNRIATIKGIGLETARTFVALFGNFEHFHSAKAFARFIGLSPTEFNSGTSVRGRSRISKNGSSKARSMLFNCARSAMRFNPKCKELYQRLVEKGKNGKVALTAVMHKLARMIFGVVHSGTDYNPDFALLKTKSS